MCSLDDTEGDKLLSLPSLVGPFLMFLASCKHGYPICFYPRETGFAASALHQAPESVPSTPQASPLRHSGGRLDPPYCGVPSHGRFPVVGGWLGRRFSIFTNNS